MRNYSVLLVVVWLCGCRSAAPPFRPRDALRTLRIEPGFHVETYVSEPDIRSPVAMEFDENGRVYVVEDPGYPLNTEGKVGRVILLDSGRRTVFADRLTMPTGIMRWKKGVLVTDAPDVIYLEDTDGDGKADVRRVILTGFAFSNPQHTVNNPVYGLDNWIYLAHEGPATAVIFPDKFGDRGSDLRFEDGQGPRLKPARRMVRFRPDTHELEYLSSSSQFGQSFDPWGHHFTVSNEDHIREEVIAAAYLDRNRDLPVGAAMERISDHRPAAEVYPITQHARVEMLSGVGSFTSACGILFYQGGAFPGMGAFTLVEEPAQNLVHRDVLEPSGATFIARRAHEGVEFLASTDPWFRPVNSYIGPDGAIYILDYYRMVIEHPEWMATHTHKSPDLYKGEDRGRIYRITPEKGLPLPENLKLGQASDDELVAQLGNVNIWWRRTAQRLLLDRRHPQTAAALVKLAETSPSPLARLHALWTLDGLGQLDPKLVERALGDPEAGVRENAILLAAPRLAATPELAEKLPRMESEANPRVQFQLLCTLGGMTSPAARAAADRLLTAHIEDRWMQMAALSAGSDRALALYQSANTFAARQSDARAAYFRQVAMVIGARRNPNEVRRVLETVARSSGPESEWWRTSSLEGLAQGLGNRPRPNFGQDLLLQLFEGKDPAVRHAALRMLSAIGLPPTGKAATGRAASVAAQADADAALRADAIGLLALDNPAAREQLFKTLSEPRQPEAVQAAAVHALGRIQGAEVGEFLIAHWRGMTPAVRMEAADAMFVDPGRPKLLLAAIRNDTVQSWTLAFRHRRQLVMHRDPGIREEARTLLEAKAGERQKVLERYEAALDKKGDPARGREVFDRVCAKCHKLDGHGHDVGPDLATVRNRPPQLILPDIIMPNKSIAQNYESYVIETKSGALIEGVMGPQTAAAITIRHEEGKEDTVRREDIKDMHVTNLSAMPEDLDKQVSVEQMADLLRFLKTPATSGGSK
jgi:putative membrane-bound dehydrogenase-like protein